MKATMKTAFLPNDDACLHADEIEIGNFLRDCLKLNSRLARVTLTSIIPDMGRGATATATFDNADKAVRWAADQNADGKSVYFQAAEPKDWPSRKLRESGIARLAYLFADIDPPKEQRQETEPLQEWQEAAISAVEAMADEKGWHVHVVVTGGGLCVLAPLSQAVGDVGAAKRLNQRFHQAFSTVGKVDATHSPAHLMRLPGTVNWADEAKRAAGRVPALARWVLETDGVNEVEAMDATLPEVAGRPEVPGKPATAGTWALIHDNEVAQVRSALWSLPLGVVESREHWLHVGMALAQWSGKAPEAFDIFDEWSQQAANYGGTLTAWESFSLDRADGIGIGTLFYMAAEHGWRRPTGGDAGVQEADAIIFPPREIIRLGGNYLADHTHHIERLLLGRGVRFYDRGGILVRPGIQHSIDANRVRTTTPRFVEVCEAFMRYTLSLHIDFEVFDGRLKKWVIKNPPPDLVKAMMSRSGQWPYLPAAAISSTPTINSAGVLLDKEGLDEETGIFIMQPVKLPTLVLTRQNAIGALQLLKGLLREFPFTSPAAASVALSALITPVVRGCMDVAPAHAVTAPAAGTGKSYLLSMASALATGLVCPAMSAGKTEEEMEKRLGAWAMTGAPIIQIDNAVNEVGGDALCQLIDQPMVNLRVLGQSRMVQAQNRQTVFINGNNLAVYGDMTRRTLLCTMDARVERPAERVFAKRPLGEIMSRRSDFVAAALTVVLAYFEAGRPDTRLTPMNSFQMWSDSVRSALVWLGEMDPCVTTADVRDNDPETLTLQAVIEGLRISGITSAETALTVTAIGELAMTQNSALIDPLSRWIAGSKFNARGAGRWLTQNKERRIGQFAMRALARNGTFVWFVVDSGIM